MKKDILDVLKELCTIQNEISEVFGDFEQMSSPISALAEIILVQYGKSTYDDIVFEQLLNFGDGNLTKKKLLEKYLVSKDKKTVK